jgi:hypothetical protein
MSEVDTETWRRSADVAVVEHDDRVVLLDLSDPAAAPVVLDGTAAVLWRLLEDVDTEARLAGAVAREFQVHPSSVRGDIHDFLLQIQSLGLVTRGELP